MQTMAPASAVKAGATQTGGVGKRRSGNRKRIETVVETLAMLRSQSETLSEVAHDARNMVTALGLYCELLEEPGVLATPYLHYGTELRLVASASRRLVEKLVALDAHLDAHAELRPSAPAATGKEAKPWSATGWSTTETTGGSELIQNRDRRESSGRNRRWDLLPALPIANLAAELLANRNLLSALAGPSIALTMETDGGALPVRLTGEDLTRVLVNLTKNAAEAIPGGGRIRISLCERPASKGAADCLQLIIDDSGPGIPPETLETIFDSGFTTRGNGTGVNSNGGWPLRHRGLGLAISRSIVEGAGGRIAARNRPQGGARFEIELPVRNSSS